MHRNYNSGIVSNNSIVYNKNTNTKTASPLIINNTTGEIIRSKSVDESTTPTSSRRSSRSYSKSPKIKPQFTNDIDDSDYEYY